MPKTHDQPDSNAACSLQSRVILEFKVSNLKSEEGIDVCVELLVLVVDHVAGINRSKEERVLYTIFFFILTSYISTYFELCADKDIIVLDCLGLFTKSN